MSNRIARIATVALFASALVASPAVAVASEAPAAPGERPNVACLQAGLGTLKSLGLLSAVAKDGIEVDGAGVLPLRTVLKLHLFDSELFMTGGVSVVLPDGSVVPATWCDGTGY